MDPVQITCDWVRLLEDRGYHASAVPWVHRGEPDGFPKLSICDKLTLALIKQAVMRLGDALDVILGCHTPPEEKAILNLERDEYEHDFVQLVMKMTNATLFTMRFIRDVLEARMAPLFRVEERANRGDCVVDFGASGR